MSAAPQRGEIAMITAYNRSEEYHAIWDGQTRRDLDGWAFCVDVPVTRRTLVLVDPDNRAQIEALRDKTMVALNEQIGVTVDGAAFTEADLANAMQAAFRVATAPREPTGFAAVVLDRNGRRWIRDGMLDADASWFYGSPPVGADWERRRYSQIDVVEVLTPGVAE